MIDLFHTLQNGDMGFYKMVANAWNLELEAPDAPSALQMLCKAILNGPLIEEMLSVMPQDAMRALQNLLDNDGLLPWAQFCNRFGEVRVMGPAKRDRIRPDLHPETTAEYLWYRGLIGKAFFQITTEPQEYAFIPEDLIPFLITLSSDGSQPLGRAATPREMAISIPVNDSILDECTTWLTALRCGYPVEAFPAAFLELPPAFLSQLLVSVNILEEDLSINPITARNFLEEERDMALAQLVDGWMKSSFVNELRLLPHLSFEGNWINRPKEARQHILEWVSTLPEGEWWSIASLISAIKEQYPDFQRPAGDYDSWFILEKETSEYLRGRVHWDKVDGALLRFVICGPMHWLGLVELAKPGDTAQPAAFRVSHWAQKLWHGSPPDGIPPEDKPVIVNMDGRLRLNQLTPRAVRYQVGRFTEWEIRKSSEYIYRITPASLRNAAEQGLRVVHLTSLMKKHAPTGLPPKLVESLERWEKTGTQAHFYPTTLLQVDNPETLSALLKTPARRFLGQMLNDKTIAIKSGGEDAVRDALLQLGYLSERKPSLPE